MKAIEDTLRWVAENQKKRTYFLLAVVLIFTFIVGIGITKVSIQTDMNKEMPQDMPIYKLDARVSDTFGGQDTIIILVRMDETGDNPDQVKDIRDPQVTEYLIAIDESLRGESTIDSVTGVGTYLSQLQAITPETTRAMLEAYPELEQFYSKDAKATILYVTADIGSSEERISELTTLIKDRLKEQQTPPGIKASITGNPPLRVDILRILARDALSTLLLASALILVLLFIMERSFTKGLLVFSPLIFGIVWTMGSMGWMDIKLSVATVGVGAMILGLGVEYGAFMLSRYHEERASGKNQLESLKAAVPSVGMAVTGSGTTTIVGFLALTLSTMPMLQHLGFALALGIAYSLLAAILVMPLIIIIEEDFEHALTERKHKEFSEKKADLERRAR